MGPNAKLVHFIRHGQGKHNVAQKEWYAAGKPGEPYTEDMDPGGAKYGDAELTELGRSQAVALQPSTASLRPDLLVVSTMRRAIQTGLLAFADQVGAGTLPVLAIELCHEIAGKHTCDKRRSRSELAAAFSAVSFSEVADEEDPYWGDGSRETVQHVAARGEAFMRWIEGREETEIAVATHSTFLLALFNGVLSTSLLSPSSVHRSSLCSWFGTGELRTVVVEFERA